MVTAFTSENQNSPSAKKRVEITLRAKITAQNTTRPIPAPAEPVLHAESAAVKLEPSATVQVSQ